MTPKEFSDMDDWYFEACTAYFEVIEGRLYAKYQQIIGSRYICDIIDYKEQ